MSTPKHAPGPWKLSKPRYIQGTMELRLDIIAENKRPVVTLVFERSGIGADGLTALTADIGAMLAAPEMLAALERMVDETQDLRGMEGALAVARAAIKKARRSELDGAEAAKEAQS